jgi:hypothetical protein
MSDRTVHAVRNDGTEIVRYDRAGKWRAEKADGSSFPFPTIRDAVEYAIEDLLEHRVNRPGGGAFARLLAALTDQEEE